MQKKVQTRDKVHEAADTLLANGQRPTQQAVRDLLGTGSITTINIALNEWWSNLSKRLNRQSEHPALPEPVITAASKLWDQALVYSQASLEEQRIALNKAFEERKHKDVEQLSQAQATLALVQKQNNQLLDTNRLLVEQKNDLSQHIHQLESSLIAANVEKEELARANKQNSLLIENNSVSHSYDHSAELMQLKIDLKVNETIIADLRQSLSAKESIIETQQQQLFDQEKSSIRQIHRLEMVIAEQDLKFTDMQKKLKESEG